MSGIGYWSSAVSLARKDGKERREGHKVGIISGSIGCNTKNAGSCEPAFSLNE